MLGTSHYDQSAFHSVTDTCSTTQRQQCERERTVAVNVHMQSDSDTNTQQYITSQHRLCNICKHSSLGFTNASASWNARFPWITVSKSLR